MDPGEPQQGWTLDALAQHEDVNKAYMLRILRTLEADRVVLRDKDVYRLGPRVLELSHGYLRGLELDTVARPFMQRLAARTGQMVSVAVRDRFEVAYIAVEKAHREIGIHGEVGGRHPANATALGKVLLADLDAAVLDALLAEHELTRPTHRTIDTPEALRNHLKVVRERLVRPDGAGAPGRVVDFGTVRPSRRAGIEPSRGAGGGQRLTRS